VPCSAFCPQCIAVLISNWVLSIFHHLIYMQDIITERSHMYKIFCSGPGQWYFITIKISTNKFVFQWVNFNDLKKIWILRINFEVLKIINNQCMHASMENAFNFLFLLIHIWTKQSLRFYSDVCSYIYKVFITPPEHTHLVILDFIQVFVHCSIRIFLL